MNIYALNIVHPLCRIQERVQTSLHGLVQITSFIGAQWIEGGHNKLPIKGAARQQALGFFGVAGVGVLHKHLLETK